MNGAKRELTSSMLLCDYLQGSTYDKKLISFLIAAMSKFDTLFPAKILYCILKKPNASLLLGNLHNMPQVNLVH